MISRQMPKNSMPQTPSMTACSKQAIRLVGGRSSTAVMQFSSWFRRWTSANGDAHSELSVRQVLGARGHVLVLQQGTTICVTAWLGIFVCRTAPATNVNGGKLRDGPDCSGTARTPRRQRMLRPADPASTVGQTSAIAEANHQHLKRRQKSTLKKRAGHPALKSTPCAPPRLRPSRPRHRPGQPHVRPRPR